MFFSTCESVKSRYAPLFAICLTSSLEIIKRQVNSNNGTALTAAVEVYFPKSQKPLTEY